MKSNTIYPPMSEREISGAAISREAATQGMVLLKNINGVLPLKGRGKIDLFGNGAARTIRGGTGSGDPFNGGLSGVSHNNFDMKKNMGIGLSVCYTIVKAHGGTMTAENLDSGGACFRFYLPLEEGINSEIEG